MIQIGHMNKVFHLKSGDVTALDNVTLNIEDGMIYGVIGYSGAGKSTLVRCLNLLETPDDGTLSVGDSGVITLRGGKAYDAQGRKLTERKLGAMRRGIGMIFQHFNLLDRSTVFENIAYPLRYTGMKKADMEARVFELLDLVDYQDKQYIVLFPVEDDDMEIVILQVEEIEGNDEEEAYVAVEDEAILDSVYGIFKERFKDEFEFED